MKRLYKSVYNFGFKRLKSNDDNTEKEVALEYIDILKSEKDINIRLGAYRTLIFLTLDYQETSAYLIKQGLIQYLIRKMNSSEIDEIFLVLALINNIKAEYDETVSKLILSNISNYVLNRISPNKKKAKLVKKYYISILVSSFKFATVKDEPLLRYFEIFLKNESPVYKLTGLKFLVSCMELNGAMCLPISKKFQNYIFQALTSEDNMFVPYSLKCFNLFFTKADLEVKQKDLRNIFRLILKPKANLEVLHLCYFVINNHLLQGCFQKNIFENLKYQNSHDKLETPILEEVVLFFIQKLKYDQKPLDIINFIKRQFMITMDRADLGLVKIILMIMSELPIKNRVRNGTFIFKNIVECLVRVSDKHGKNVQRLTNGIVNRIYEKST